VHSNQRKPVPPVHSIPSKIDSKSRLRELWWNFLCWQSYFPGFIRVSIQAQVILILKKHTKDFKFNRRTQHIIKSLENPNLMGIKTQQKGMWLLPSNHTQTSEHINTTSFNIPSTTNRMFGFTLDKQKSKIIVEIPVIS